MKLVSRKGYGTAKYPGLTVVRDCPMYASNTRDERDYSTLEKCYLETFVQLSFLPGLNTLGVCVFR